MGLLNILSADDKKIAIYFIRHLSDKTIDMMNAIWDQGRLEIQTLIEGLTADDMAVDFLIEKYKCECDKLFYFCRLYERSWQEYFCEKLFSHYAKACFLEEILTEINRFFNEAADRKVKEDLMD